ncbi:MAG: antitoxin [Armatimonadetes bacterium CG07_land_8_20_14_0_80_40_9]|nr:MAG: antitoxin [Armatimonadetes bacterium CG07_land_8_20_14_0_80_40_9]
MGYKLTKEENDLVESVEKGEWKSIKNFDQEKKRHQKYANATLKKDKRINIRLTTFDLEKIQEKAVEEGLPYQTLITSVLHKFVKERLREKRS